jgi:hypothetical protein
MNKIILLTRPNHDNTTNYLFNWAQRIVLEAEAKGFQLLDLKETKANRKEFENVIRSKNPSLVLLYGHGNSYKVGGHNDEILIEAGDNENMLKLRIIHALTCKSAKFLGPKSIDAGALAYIGYDEDFIFCCIPEKTSEPLEDKLASFFLNPPEILIKSLLIGNSAAISVARARRLFKSNVKQLLTIENSKYNYAIPYLLWNMDHLKLVGDSNASF